ncbi:MAG: hypothetical protein GX808_13960 [Syntrophomonadaceae bacterium]|jgi:hypothetical protein|nr:hypothetical protein [Syntrophomonadaceae bacterium]
MKCGNRDCKICYPEYEADRFEKGKECGNRYEEKEYRESYQDYEAEDSVRDRKYRFRYADCEPDRRRRDDKKYKPDCPKDGPDRKDDDECVIQTHNHEFAGSVMVAGSIPHTHRFAGVTSQAIPEGRSHVHAILTDTDFFFNHLHEVGITTGSAIPVPGGKHIHLAKGETTENFGHDHDFIFTTFIEDPLQK